ncbi:MAG: geranylgeranylglyceryl/heptaprenylglyceryl phosphate synthase [Candidatus Bathyarchaeota archaeon]|nr:geranylgeranylglyceryl/heptaprenylglyceryl phosphate synthase [Candidatus Bathyarchaeum tardum]WGM89671.1 MAG: geranylgeranylglyceryl/heptaprenylglyceryl phosphate synthase [Candidatus Bathyarchaeum tardum]WNZ30229.1 MAG: geranylgeranylglyceryl/heptaprenylglyceryl phosphate synthase [Candidatus Bathyarchaeota archaeon]
MIGTVEQYLLNKINKEGAIHLTLIDPEKVTPCSAVRTAKEAESCNTAAIMVGGSTSITDPHLDDVTKALKDSVEIPIILFPGNHNGVTKYADAIWFMSLLNSSDPYFLVGAQILGAPIIKKFGIEPISMGYITVGEGGTVSIVGKATPLPYSKPELAAAHALAAEYFGMHFVYLEAGSGVGNPVPVTLIKAVKTATNLPIIVGGGIRTGKQAKEIVNAGASIIVTGNVLEENKSKNKIQELISNIKTR